MSKVGLTIATDTKLPRALTMAAFTEALCTLPALNLEGVARITVDLLLTDDEFEALKKRLPAQLARLSDLLEITLKRTTEIAVMRRSTVVTIAVLTPLERAIEDLDEG